MTEFEFCDKMTSTLAQSVWDAFSDGSATIMERGEWMDAEKSNLTRDTVVEYDNMFFCIVEARTFIAYDDYEMAPAYIYQVEPKKVMVTKWVAV